MAEPEIKVVGLSGNKPKGTTNWKVMGAIIGIVVLAVGVIAGIVLVKQNQNIQEKASCTAACPDNRGYLINCYNTADSNGAESVCNAAGRIEVCGQTASDARQYCCPSVNAAWTTNLSLCATSTPTATATAIATATSTTKATATTTATATATGQPNSCNGTCGSNSNCASGLYCYQGFCRNASCSTDTDCICGSATATATAKATGATKATGTAKATSQPIPVTGVEWPTMLGAGFGIVMILASLMLAL
jgi:hypothetical protein